MKILSKTSPLAEISLIYCKNLSELYETNIHFALSKSQC